jgi:hypothetical protein
MKPTCLAPFKSVYVNPEGFSPCCYIPNKRFANLSDYESSEWLKDMQNGQLSGNTNKMHPRCASCINDKTNSSFFTELGYGKNKKSTLEYDSGDLSKTHIYIAASIKCGMSCTMCLVSDKRLRELEDTGIKEQIDLYSDMKYNIDVPQNILEEIYGVLGGAEIVSGHT